MPVQTTLSQAVNPLRLELLWRRLEDAKLRLDHCHNYIKEIKQDKLSGAVSFSDGNYAHVHALRAEEVAVKRYLKALGDFKTALMMERVPRAATEEPEADGTQSAISPREREVLALIAAGKSSRQIAAHLGISFKTVTTHRYRLQTKMHVHNTADLMRAALQMGLIELNGH